MSTGKRKFDEVSSGYHLPQRDRSIEQIVGTGQIEIRPHEVSVLGV